MPYRKVHGDITRMRTDAIVNAANTKLRAGGGVCGAIFRAAGGKQLQDACDSVRTPIPVGSAVMTSGYNLPARHVIHAVGPVYADYSPRDAERLLASAYKSALTIALDAGLHSIAFPLISAGIYGYPPADALRVAENAINEFLANHDADMDVIMVLYGDGSELNVPISDRVRGWLSAILHWRR